MEEVLVFVALSRKKFDFCATITSNSWGICNRMNDLGVSLRYGMVINDLIRLINYNDYDDNNGTLGSFKQFFGTVQ